MGPISVLAASFSFNAPTNVRVGDQFEAVVEMDTENERINAVQGTIEVPGNLEVKEIRDGNTIINFWIEKPSVIVAESSVKFAGAIPGGYLGKGKLFSVVFEAKSGGEAVFNIEDSLALLNDGQGTPAKLSIKILKLSVGELVPGEASKIVVVVEDELPPSEFKPEIGQDQNIFDGKYFLVFAAQDKESGVDFYQVSEERGFWRWLIGPNQKTLNKANSPYLLQDQELRSWIFVRAVDRVGNERIVLLRPRGISLGEQVLTIFGYAIVILVLILLGWRVLKRRT